MFISDSLSETDCINYFPTRFCELMRCFPIGRSRQGCRERRERKRKRIEICNGGRRAILRFSLLQLVTPHLIRYSPRIALLERRNKYLITKLVPFLRFPSPPPLFLYCTPASIECAQVSQTFGLLNAEAVHDCSNWY